MPKEGEIDKRKLDTSAQPNLTDAMNRRPEIPQALVETDNDIDIVIVPPLVVSTGDSKGDIAPQDHSGTAPKPNLDVSGAFRIKQENPVGGTGRKATYLVDVVLHQHEGHLSGHASHSGGKVTSQSVEGTVDGERVEFVITWSNGSRGRYVSEEHLADGHFTGGTNQGILKGTTHDETNPNVTGTWEAEKSFTRVL